ncbi:MAG: zinc-binding dehydrogenase [Phycisphaerales bacterium]|nr:MAG: zinc-binding dehydrogenase [Phycisphaerales bacterium]
MKAAIIEKHGELDVLEVKNVPVPQPGPDEVVLKVLCAGLNHLDIWVRKGRPGASLEMPHILGSDAVGVVEAVGERVESATVGEEVVLYPGLGCGRCEFCIRGRQNLCTSFGIIGLNRPGTFAERVAVPAANVYPKPAHMSCDEAGGFALAYLTAWHMLVGRARIRAGDVILIHGIGGGVALCALQLARLLGAEVIATSSSDDKLKRARDLGAGHTINYREEDVPTRVRDITAGRGVDVAFDTVGAATWPLDFACVRRGGTIVICGITTGPVAETNLQALYWNQLTVLGSTLGSLAELGQMARAVTISRLKPVVDEVFPLEQARDAMGKMEAGRQFGKIVLSVAR